MAHAVKRHQGMSKRRPCLWRKYVSYHFHEPNQALEPWVHEPKDLICYLIEAGVLSPDEPLLELLNYYTPRDFDSPDLAARKPSSLEFDQLDLVHQTLLYATKEIQREETWDPVFLAPHRLTWNMFCITLGLTSWDPALAHPHFLKAFVYHVKNRLWFH